MPAAAAALFALAVLGLVVLFLVVTTYNAVTKDCGVCSAWPA